MIMSMYCEVVVYGCMYTVQDQYNMVIDAHLLKTAVCSPACQGGGTCVAPNTCMCPGGLEGNVCGSGM